MGLTSLLVALTAVVDVSDEFADEARDLRGLLEVVARAGEPVDDLAAHATERARLFCARLATRPGVDQARMAALYHDLTSRSA